ncbi:MAG: MlaE family lipid ABC transporter permease subunit [Hyphomicrobiales bacterium]|nr:MAG: MlaE family lipid ABC transporter permease subunit [Hyphomicrobiales bacterium]
MWQQREADQLHVIDEPTLAATGQDGLTVVTPKGDWTAAFARELEALVGARTAAPTSPPARIDMKGVGRLDTYGAWLIVRLARVLGSPGAPADIADIPEHFSALMAEMGATNRTPVEQPPRTNVLTDGLAAVGRSVADLARESLVFTNMLGAVCLSLLGVVLRPRQFRLISAVHHIDRVAWQAVPIVLLITFLIGGIVAQQGFFHFRKFGADEYVVDMVGILVLRELGVLIVAIMVAGRSGSSYTAELGSMKMREEIDALRTMGIDPVNVLLLPRILALVIGLPLLTFLGSMAALYGGGLVAWLYGGMSPEIFIARLKDAISVTHFKVGMIKAPFMALAIGVVACVEGLKVQGSAESLGLQTTNSVVKSIFLVILLDGLFAIFFASIGM